MYSLRSVFIFLCSVTSLMFSMELEERAKEVPVPAF